MHTSIPCQCICATPAGKGSCPSGACGQRASANFQYYTLPTHLLYFRQLQRQQLVDPSQQLGLGGAPGRSWGVPGLQGTCRASRPCGRAGRLHESWAERRRHRYARDIWLITAAVLRLTAQACKCNARVCAEGKGTPGAVVTQGNSMLVQSSSVCIKSYEDFKYVSRAQVSVLCCSMRLRTTV